MALEPSVCALVTLKLCVAAHLQKQSQNIPIGVEIPKMEETSLKNLNTSITKKSSDTTYQNMVINSFGLPVPTQKRCTCIHTINLEDKRNHSTPHLASHLMCH